MEPAVGDRRRIRAAGDRVARARGGAPQIVRSTWRRCARKQFIEPAQPARRRGELPLPPPPDPRHRLQRPAQARARQPAHRLRALGRPGQRRARARRRVRGDPRLPPRTGAPLPAANWGRWTSRASAIGADAAQRLCRRRTARVRARRHACRGQPATARRRAAARQTLASRLALLPELGETPAWSWATSTARARCSTRPRPPAQQLGDERARARQHGWSACSCACTAANRATGAPRRCARRQRGDHRHARARAARTTNSRSAWRLIAFVHGDRRPLQPGQRGHRALHGPCATRRQRAPGRRAAALGLANGAAARADAGARGDRAMRAHRRRAASSDRQVQSVVMCILAQLRAMNGDFDDRAPAVPRRPRVAARPRAGRDARRRPASTSRASSCWPAT